MEELNFKKLQKRKKFIGFKVNAAEREMIDRFCLEKSITISDLVRTAVERIIETNR